MPRFKVIVKGHGAADLERASAVLDAWGIGVYGPGWAQFGESNGAPLGDDKITAVLDAVGEMEAKARIADSLPKIGSFRVGKAERLEAMPDGA